ncbi:ExeA family protein [Tichowtungia aerotolerans]|uniref:AAA family ATPase n=1 Tax=Tichowtungia aerotolerans TaxID=2697043 RepID=A0A6P1M947_9BACT|nr:AAA family ATPase [Tichowtungia aerotolerans]QHI70552.1 AAA family ATPase [Tichowtungia aerotolerans]
MYLDYFQLNEFPFNVTPDPRFLYFSDRHQEAYDSLLYGIEHRKGFIVLTGEVGCGKTTICRSVLNQLPTNTHSALILNPSLTPSQLIRSILIDLGLDAKGQDKLVHIALLNEFLLDCLNKNENVCIIIDESQNLDADLMEQIRMLSNLETDQHKLMQIILSGQPELKERLAMPELRQLRQRVMVHCDLSSLSTVETALYIQHRLNVAGANGRIRFRPMAVERVHEHGAGIPRQINTICDRALLSAYVRKDFEVTDTDVQNALKELASVIHGSSI